MKSAIHSSATSPRPWWSFGHVWLLVAGPAIVVVAGFVTFYIAVSSPDPVLPTQPAVSSNAGEAHQGISQAPAVQARNHAATGALPVQKTTKP